MAGGTRPGPVPVTAAAVASVLVAAFALLSGGQKAATLGLIPVRLALLAGLATTTTSSGHDVLGYLTLAASDYARSGLTTTLTLEAVGRVVSGVTGTLVLWDGDSESAAATLTWTETDLDRKTASVTVPTETTYELRFSKSGGGDDDFALVSAVHLTVDWS